MQLDVAINHISEVYEKAAIVKTGRHYTTVNELTDQIPATRPETLWSALTLLLKLGPVLGNKILAEEDKGAVIAGLFSVVASEPLAMARFYNYELPPHLGSVVVPVSMEYATGRLLVNGIERGDRLVIVDDTLATGGTAVSLVRAAQRLGASVVEMRVIIEKLGFGGRERLLKEVGLEVKAAVGISVNGVGSVRIDEIMGQRVGETQWNRNESK